MSKPACHTETITWHDANTQKPEPDRTVLCCRAEDFFMGFYDEDLNSWIDNGDGGMIDGVIHWADPMGPEK